MESWIIPPPPTTWVCKRCTGMGLWVQLLCFIHFNPFLTSEPVLLVSSFVLKANITYTIKGVNKHKSIHRVIHTCTYTHLLCIDEQQFTSAAVKSSPSSLHWVENPAHHPAQAHGAKHCQGSWRGRLKDVHCSKGRRHMSEVKPAYAGHRKASTFRPL